MRVTEQQYAWPDASVPLVQQLRRLDAPMLPL
jgi:hypothetical protein